MRNLFRSDILCLMLTPDLIEYLKSVKVMNPPPLEGDVRAALISAGWNEDDIHEAMAFLRDSAQHVVSSLAPHSSARSESPASLEGRQVSSPAEKFIHDHLADPELPSGKKINPDSLLQSGRLDPMLPDLREAFPMKVRGDQNAPNSPSHATASVSPKASHISPPSNVSPMRISIFFVILIAAALLGVVAGGAYYLFKKGDLISYENSFTVEVYRPAADVLPPIFPEDAIRDIGEE